MKSFAYIRATDVATAVQAVAEHPNAKFLGGGTNLVDLMREDIEHPDTVIDVTSLPLTTIDVRPDGGLHIGSAVRNGTLAAHPAVRATTPCSPRRC